MQGTARRIMGGKGKRLHVQSMNIRRAENQSFIVQHELADRQGNPPIDGQRSHVEYAIPNRESLLAHVAKHVEAADENEPADEPDSEGDD
jgi:hypothetical protein